MNTRPVESVVSCLGHLNSPFFDPKPPIFLTRLMSVRENLLTVLSLQLTNKTHVSEREPAYSVILAANIDIVPVYSYTPWSIQLSFTQRNYLTDIHVTPNNRPKEGVRIF